LLISGPTGPVLAPRRPSPCRAPDADCPRLDADQRHRDEHPVTATTNAALNVCIFDEGFVGKIDDGQHPAPDCFSAGSILTCLSSLIRIT
jgi:hypothetical protein